MTKDEFKKLSRASIDFNRLFELSNTLPTPVSSALFNCIHFDSDEPDRFEDETEDEYNSRMFDHVMRDFQP
jgi:hypothetical protein